jgi:hypothetical protein
MSHATTLIGDRMKPLRFAIASLALPIALAAQQPAASQGNVITAAFKARILATHRNIAQAFDAIPASKFGYKPTPAQLSVGFIAQHVASDSYLYCNTFGDLKANIPEADVSTADSVKATWPKEQLVSKLKASFAFCAQAIGQLADSTLADSVSLIYAGSKRTTTRANMVLNHAIDLADHYSQLANYMRLNNLVPPSALPRPKPGN